MESDPYLNSLWLSWGYTLVIKHKVLKRLYVFDLGTPIVGPAFAYTGLTRAQETLTSFKFRQLQR